MTKNGVQGGIGKMSRGGGGGGHIKACPGGSEGIIGGSGTAYKLVQGGGTK